MCKIPSKMKWLFFGVLGLAPGHCSEKCEILQVRRDDQSRYHNLKPPSSVGSGWNEVHCPPADLVQIRNIQRPNRSFTSVQMFHTHTNPHTHPHTHSNFYTRKLLHTNTFTHKSFYTQKLLHTNTFTHRSFYTQKLLHIEAFTHKSFYAQKIFP